MPPYPILIYIDIYIFQDFLDCMMAAARKDHKRNCACGKARHFRDILTVLN